MEAPPDLLAWLGDVCEDGDRATVAALRVEASTRSFFRVSTPASTFVAMRSPPATENNPRFARLAALFRRFGVATPQIFATDFERGFLLLEDLGERDFEAAYGDGDVEGPLAGALGVLERLSEIPTDEVPPYTRQRFADELEIFAEWLVRRWLGLDAPPFFNALRDGLVEATQSVPTTVVHRDFHCRNLLWRSDGRVGVVDFQDALAGPVCYDIASLLRDCYVAFDEATVALWRRRHFQQARLARTCDAATFDRAFDLTALQRQLKAVGIFARLHLRDRRDSHLDDIVPVLKRIAALAPNYPETTELAAWIVENALPAAALRLPGCRGQ